MCAVWFKSVSSNRRHEQIKRIKMQESNEIIGGRIIKKGIESPCSRNEMYVEDFC